MNQKKGRFLLQTTKQLNWGAGLSGLGFLLYLFARIVGFVVAADVIVMLCAVVSAWVFLSVVVAREKDKDIVGYNLLWGTGALALLMVSFATLTVRMYLGV